MIKRLREILGNERGCFGGGGSAQPTPPPAPQQAQGDVQAGAEADRKRRRAAAGNTILTGPQGTTGGSAGGDGKQLLGS